MVPGTIKFLVPARRGTPWPTINRGRSILIDCTRLCRWRVYNKLYNMTKFIVSVTTKTSYNNVDDPTAASSRICIKRR